MSPLLLLVAGFFVLLLLRVPVAFSLLLPSLVYLVFGGASNLDLATPRIIANLNSFTLVAVPMFILMGGLANAAGVTDRLFDFSQAILRNVRGGLGYVNIAVSFGFSWMSGTAVADAAGLGKLEIPAMVARGYDKRFSAGVTAASALISPVMPPSIPAVLYALSAGVSLGGLLVAGIVPASLMALSLAVVVYFYARNKDELREGPASLKQIGLTAVRAIPAFVAPVVLIGGILGGVFTPTEAAGVSVLYILGLGIVSGSIRLETFYRVMVDAAATTGSVLLIVGSASVFAWIIAIERGPEILTTFLLGVSDNPLIFLLMVNGLGLVVGMFVDAASAILILVPILLPAASSYGIDPLHFGIIIIVNLMIGLLTPPVGIVLYVISSVAEMPFSEVVRGAAPFLVPLGAVMLLLTYVPAVSLFLPRLFGF